MCSLIYIYIYIRHPTRILYRPEIRQTELKCQYDDRLSLHIIIIIYIWFNNEFSIYLLLFTEFTRLFLNRFNYFILLNNLQILTNMSIRIKQLIIFDNRWDIIEQLVSSMLVLTFCYHLTNGRLDSIRQPSLIDGFVFNLTFTENK